MPLSQEIKDQIEEGILAFPCIKCGSPEHPVVNHKGSVALQGQVWRALKGAEFAQAEAHLTKVKTALIKQRNAAKKAASSNADPSTPKTAPTAIEPIIAPAGFPVIDTVGTDPHATLATPQLLVIQEQAQREPVDTVFRQATNAPSTTQLAPGHTHEPAKAKLSIASAKFPMRKQFAKSTGQVLTNYFEVSWNKDTKFFVYEIIDIPAGNKRKTKAVLKTAIQAWDFLLNNQAHFATDDLKFIVAWTDLHTGIQCPRKSTPPNEVVWTPIPIADGDRRIQLNFKYHGEMNLDRLQHYVNPSSKPNDSALPDFNFNLLLAYLNTVIAKNLTDEVFSTSSHKFFFKNGYETLGRSKSLCIMRGYNYTISPAMEKVLLNVNAATSAFHCPITVAEFLKDNTFPHNERERRIKRLRVYIIPDRQAVTDPEEQLRVDSLNKPQNRIKTVKAFGGRIGDRSDGALKFRKWLNIGGQLQQANIDTHVVDHMKSVFGGAHRFDEKLKAVNVGSDDDPVWYPQEFLRILPYQLYNNLLPDTLIDSMLKLACKTPDHVRASIEAEGLKGLGVIQKNGVQKFVGIHYCLINHN
jgi:eukaryotic translation initiation factor 2C